MWIMEKMQPLFSGVAFIGMIMLLALNHPEKQVRLKVSGDKHVRVLLWVRALLIVPFTLLSLFLFAKTVTKIS